jgi:N-acetylglucosamine-6-phosphate deacetylase
VSDREPFAIRGQLALGGRLEPGAVIVEQGFITGIERNARDGDLPERIIDAPIISPGFIDLQVNGGFGVDVDDRVEPFEVLARRLPETGVTSYLPTLISSVDTTYPNVFTAFERGRTARGARALGLHLEGPFLSPARKGAHPKAAIDGATDELFDAIADPRFVALMTLAPERAGAGVRIRTLRDRGILVSLGHTDATVEQFTAGVDAGARMATHLFNAMSPFGHRAPGVIGAVLVEDRVMAGMIVDGVHSHPSAVQLAVRAKGTDRLVLVTDMMAAAGMPPGTYALGGQAVTTDGASARLSDGTLAGATLLMNEAIRNTILWTGIGIADALRMATENPAMLLNRDDIGVLRIGARADFSLMDADINVISTIVNGEIIFIL